jgi:hypothetical protein
MGLIRGKRALVFTLIAFLLAGLFIILYTTDVRTPFDSRVELQSMRIRGLRSFTTTYEQYAVDSIGYSLRNAFRAVLLYETETGRIPKETEELTCLVADVMMDGKIMDFESKEVFDWSFIHYSWFYMSFTGENGSTLSPDHDFNNDM